MLKNVETIVFEFYMHWGLMAVPLVPFMVLFCHAIETCDPTHLEPLAAVVETVDMIPPDLPNVYRKQLHLFKLMYEVACKYVGSRTNNPPVQVSGRIPDTPFEMLFFEAGVPVPSHLNMQANMQGFSDGTQLANEINYGGLSTGQAGNIVEGSFDHNMELGNWFEQNQEIFMMLDNNQS
uniref:Uncharacterized protein n=2 Tax=Fusarium oxysporum TaxID=5507 RepID=A0A0D2YAQ4_FUSOF